jgi:hypothetical protein
MTIVPLTRLGVPLSGITRTGDTADGYRVMSARRLAHAHKPLSYLEMALVVAVLGIAAAVAVPEFFQLRQDADDETAKSRLVQAGRSVETGAAVPAGVHVRAAGSSYCLEAAVSGRVWHALPHAKPVQGACPAR